MRKSLAILAFFFLNIGPATALLLHGVQKNIFYLKITFFQKYGCYCLRSFVYAKANRVSSCAVCYKDNDSTVDCFHQFLTHNLIFVLAMALPINTYSQVPFYLSESLINDSIFDVSKIKANGIENIQLTELVVDYEKLNKIDTLCKFTYTFDGDYRIKTKILYPLYLTTKDSPKVCTYDYDGEILLKSCSQKVGEFFYMRGFENSEIRSISKFQNGKLVKEEEEIFFPRIGQTRPYRAKFFLFNKNLLTKEIIYDYNILDSRLVDTTIHRYLYDSLDRICTLEVTYPDSVRSHDPKQCKNKYKKYIINNRYANLNIFQESFLVLNTGDTTVVETNKITNYTIGKTLQIQQLVNEESDHEIINIMLAKNAPPFGETLDIGNEEIRYKIDYLDTGLPSKIIYFSVFGLRVFQFDYFH